MIDDSPNGLIKGISRALQVPINTIYSLDKGRTASDARHIAFEILARDGRLNQKQIAQHFNAKDCTISRGRTKFRNLSQTDKLFQAKIEKCRILIPPNSPMSTR